MLPYFKRGKAYERRISNEKLDGIYVKIALFTYNIKTSINTVLQSFCDIFCAAINAKRTIKAEFYYDKESNLDGYFDSDKSLLRINLKNYKIVDYLQLIDGLLMHDQNSSVILNCKAFIDLYAPRHGNATTVLHELEHARRFDQTGEHKHGFHAQGLNAQAQLVDFDACANSYGIMAMQTGLISAWSKQIKKLIQPMGWLISWLIDLESTDKDYLMETLGFTNS